MAVLGRKPYSLIRSNFSYLPKITEISVLSVNIILTQQHSGGMILNFESIIILTSFVNFTNLMF